MTTDRSMIAWQRRLLPFMTFMLIVGVIGFSAASFVAFIQIDKSIVKSRQASDLLDARNRWEALARSDLKASEFVARASLDTIALEERYELSRGMIRARLWTRFMGFVTGMILAIVGAAFVLGKLSESESKLTSETSGASLSLSTSSPGLILAGLGTILMALAILVPGNAVTSDGAAYLESTAPPMVSPSASALDGDKATSRSDILNALAQPEGSEARRK